MVSHSRRLKSGQITCYLNRTYHVLTTILHSVLDTKPNWEQNSALIYNMCKDRALEAKWLYELIKVVVLFSERTASIRKMKPYQTTTT